MSDTSQKTAILSIPGMDPIELPILKGTLGPEVIDIRALGSHGYFTYEPGFVSTASCNSRITFIDGARGVLLYRGYPIDQLATGCDYLQVCYLRLNGDLPVFGIPEFIAPGCAQESARFIRDIQYCFQMKFLQILPDIQAFPQ